MNALIIDDSRVIRRILREILVELGFTVAEAGNGREGVEMLERSAAVDIVFVDWNMPEMNGLEVVERVRADARWAGLPLVMVTTENELEAISKALAAGASEFIMKPFDRQIVRDKLQLLGIGAG